MAKKYRKSVVNKSKNPAILIYGTGVVHSTVIHSIVLLVLSLIYLDQQDKKNIPIRLSFSSYAETLEPDLSKPEELEEQPIKIVSLEESDKQLQASSMVKSIDVVSAPADDIPLPDFPIPDSGIDKQSDFLDNISIDVLTQEIKTDNSPNKKQVAYTGRTNQQLLLSRRGMSRQMLVPNQAETSNFGEIQQRLKEYGAKTGDVQISLSWDTVDDIDLYVIVKPINSQINWTNRVGICGGALDIDMNAHPRFLSNRPIENIFWGPGNAPYGEYSIGIHFFMNWSGAQRVSGTVLIKKDNQTENIPFTVIYGQPPTLLKSFMRQQ